jgi:chromosome segregation ATPase
MDNSKYLNYYVEILTNTLTDAVVRNVSLQANARVSEDVINDQVKRNEDLSKQISNLNAEVSSVKESNQQNENIKVANLENAIKGHLNTINNLTNQLAELNKMKGEYENIKHQVNHVDTFRNELVKERDEHQKTRNIYEDRITELNTQIEYLQLTPAKRKKLEEEKNKTVEVLEESSVLPLVDETIKDGGSF